MIEQQEMVYNEVETMDYSSKTGKVKDWMQMFGLNDMMDQLAMINIGHWSR